MRKGRKPGYRNKTEVERIIDAVVTAAGGTHEDTVNMLTEHYNTAKRREKRKPGSAIREEFVEGNAMNDAYLGAFGLKDKVVVESLARLVEGATNGNVPRVGELPGKK